MDQVSAERRPNVRGSFIASIHVASIHGRRSRRSTFCGCLAGGCKNANIAPVATSSAYFVRSALGLGAEHCSQVMPRQRTRTPTAFRRVGSRRKPGCLPSVFWLIPADQAWSEEGRRDTELMAELQARGVPAGQITFIKDQNATVAAVRECVRRRLAEGNRRHDPVVLFCRTRHQARERRVRVHAVRRGLAVADIFSSIERRFAGTTALLFADCCYSGSLGDGGDAARWSGELRCAHLLACLHGVDGGLDLHRMLDCRVARGNSAQRSTDSGLLTSRSLRALPSGRWLSTTDSSRHLYRRTGSIPVWSWPQE